MKSPAIAAPLVLAAALLAPGCGSSSDDTTAPIRSALSSSSDDGEFVVSECSYRTGEPCPSLPSPDACALDGPLPDPDCTPGALNAAVTEDTLDETLCRSGGYTDSVRPPRGYTDALKPRIMTAYGLENEPVYKYELDHLIPLGLGGAAADIRNLWPEPEFGPHDASEKNDLAGTLNREICNGDIDLADAQQEILDWADQ